MGIQKLFLYINAKKIETVISYFDNYLWNAGIQKNILYLIRLNHLSTYLSFQ